MAEKQEKKDDVATDRLSSDVEHSTFKETKQFDNAEEYPAPGRQVIQEPGVASK